MPGKKIYKRKNKTRKRKGGGDRDESVQKEMSDWRPGFDHPDQSVPDHVLQNISEHLQAQEEAAGAPLVHPGGGPGARLVQPALEPRGSRPRATSDPAPTERLSAENNLSRCGVCPAQYPLI